MLYVLFASLPPTFLYNAHSSFPPPTDSYSWVYVSVLPLDTPASRATRDDTQVSNVNPLR